MPLFGFFYIYSTTQLLHSEMVWVFKEKMWSILLGKQWLQSLMSYSKEKWDLSSLTEIIHVRPVQKSSIFKHGLKAEKLLDVRMQ